MVAYRQCRINHSAGCTMGGAPPPGGSDQLLFFTTQFWLLNIEKTFTNHKFLIGLRQMWDIQRLKCTKIDFGWGSILDPL